MFWLMVILRWMHVLGAIGLVGGALFVWRVVLPAHEGLDIARRKEQYESMRPQWARLVMISILLLLVSGIANVFLMGRNGEFKLLQSHYHVLLLVKFMLALVVFFLFSLITGRSTGAQHIRDNLGKWLPICFLLAVIVICIAGVMKMTPRIHRNRADADPSFGAVQFVRGATFLGKGR